MMRCSKLEKAAIRNVRRVTTIVVAVAIASFSAVAQEPEQELIRMRLEGLPERPLLDNVRVADGRVLAALYAQRAFRPVWRKRSNAAGFVSLIARAEEEGLNPADYHWPKLAQMLADLDGSLESDLQRVELDLLLTDSLLRYAYHLRFGKVDPASLNPHWNLTRAMPGSDTLDRLQAIADSEDPARSLAAAIPQIPYYKYLKQALRHYRTSREHGTWTAIPAGSSLRLGITDARVRALRERLRLTGNLEYMPIENPSHFDYRLEHAVREFQVRHGLRVDGIVGRATLAALNVPISARIDQLRVNLERARWVFQDIEDDYLMVNIAAYEASLFRSGIRVWSARTVVGKPFRKTPIFKSKITHVVLNPTWTVPPTILREDLLPKMKSDPEFMDRKNMKIFDNRGGIVDPYSIDWSVVDPYKFPFTIRQEPGAGNAMGNVKLILPNPYFVYLHDTPSKELFERADRSFSSGCIRVENALALTELVLDDLSNWNSSAIGHAIESGHTQNVSLTRPLTTMILYRTNDVDAAGNVYFLPDVYYRDRMVLEALNGPFVFSPPERFDEQFPDVH